MTTVKRDRRAGLGARIWNNLQEFWAWVDERQIDAHLISTSLVGAWLYVVYWACTFGWNNAGKIPGADIAMTIAAVTGPVSIALPIALNFILRAREKSFINPPQQIVIQQPTTTQTVTTTQ